MWVENVRRSFDCKNFMEYALACNLSLSVRLSTTVQISPRDDTSSSDRANTLAILMRVGTHFGLTLTNLASADRHIKIFVSVRWLNSPLFVASK